jgi:hypothetical protein
VLHNLLINYDEDDIPKEWYDKMNDNIYWSMYNSILQYLTFIYIYWGITVV